MILRRFSLALLLCSALVPGIAHAQEVSEGDKATARQLVIEGFAALEHKDYVTAADRFSRADTVVHAPTVSLGLARAQVGLGKFVSAQENYNRVIHEMGSRRASTRASSSSARRGTARRVFRRTSSRTSTATARSGASRAATMSPMVGPGFLGARGTF